jgi:hypothetical protein
MQLFIVSNRTEFIATEGRCGSGGDAFARLAEIYTGA